MPIVSGQRLTAPQFLNYIRTNINSFINTFYSEFTPYTWFGTDETALWYSSNPTGAVIAIDIGGPDNGSVVVSQYTSNKWTFSTIFDPMYGQHPVSGHRDFGFDTNPDGSYTFYTRGVDRLTSIDGQFFQDVTGIPFNYTEALWTSFQNKINDFVRSHNGDASVQAPQISRPDWEHVKDVLAGNAPLNSLSTDCP